MISPAALNNIKNRCEDIDTMIEALEMSDEPEKCFRVIRKCTESIRVQVQCMELEAKEGGE